VAGLVGAVAGRVKARVPVADLDDRDPDYIRDNLPGLWLLASFYFRARVRGLERVPRAGPVLLVGNHSGGNVTPDTIVSRSRSASTSALSVASTSWRTISFWRCLLGLSAQVRDGRGVA
jgi:hypothetical protein